MTTYDLGRVVGSDGQQGAKGDKGDTGDTGNGISSITKVSTSGLVDTYSIAFTNGNTTTFTVTNGSDGAKGDKGDTGDTGAKGDKGDKGDTGDTGAKGDTGATGNGISSVTKTGSSGLVDTYTITFTSGATTTFQVTNGKDGSDASVTIVSSWSATTSDAKVPSEKLAKTSLDGKVDKVTGKGLSTNDFTNSYKSTIDGLSTVASSGSYNDLSNKPSIPSSSSDLSDGSDLVKKSSTSGLLKNDGSVMTGGTGSTNWAIGNHTHSGYVSATKVTSWQSTPSDSNVPSEKLVKNSLDDKIGKSSTSGLVKNDGSIDTSTYLTSSAISGMLTSSDVANNLTTTASGKVLDARQGKALADLIGDAITYINQ